MFLSCENQIVESSQPPMGNTVLEKAVIYDAPFEIDLDLDGPYIYYDCVDGVELTMHGKIQVNQKVVETPSGHIRWNGNVDYFAFGPITLSGDEETWTLVKGLNPFHDIVKENGVYNLNYTIHEFYTNPSGDKLKILIEGRFTISENGTEFFRENYKCIVKNKK